MTTLSVVGGSSAEPPTKKCERCGEERPVTAFAPCGSRHKGGRYRTRVCRRCKHTAGESWRAKNSERHKRYSREQAWRSYGIAGFTHEHYDAMLAEQAGKCAVCGGLNDNGKALCVDHDHKTGLVRGLLCRRCNVLIGYASDDTALLTSAVGYLREHGK